MVITLNPTSNVATFNGAHKQSGTQNIPIDPMRSSKSTSSSRYTKLTKKLESCDIPPSIHEQIMQDLDRLQKTPPFQPEHHSLATYLEIVADLPWAGRYPVRSTSSPGGNEATIDLQVARQILDKDHFGIESVKKRILQFLAVRRLIHTRDLERQRISEENRGKRQHSKEKSMSGDEPNTLATMMSRSPSAGKSQDTADIVVHSTASHSPILLLVGPPGVGKTSLGKSIAKTLDLPFCRISLGGVRDEAQLRGHRRTYIGAMPGRLVTAITKAKSWKLVVMLDEVDKLSTGGHHTGAGGGDLSSALLEILDPDQNNAFSGRYIS